MAKLVNPNDNGYGRFNDSDDDNSFSDDNTDTDSLIEDDTTVPDDSFDPGSFHADQSVTNPEKGSILGKLSDPKLNNKKIGEFLERSIIPSVITVFTGKNSKPITFLILRFTLSMKHTSMVLDYLESTIKSELNDMATARLLLGVSESDDQKKAIIKYLGSGLKRHTTALSRVIDYVKNKPQYMQILGDLQ